jgi:hypothetical protein
LVDGSIGIPIALIPPLSIFHHPTPPDRPS